MVKRKTGDKRSDIMRATITEVVTSGSSAASINTISKRAGLAVGTIYRYFDSKEDVLRSTYMSVKAEMHTALVSAASQGSGSKEPIRAMWFGILEFALEHPQAFLFVEVVLNDLILADADRNEIAEMALEIRAFVEKAIAEGIVQDLDRDAIMTLLASPALRLGRVAAMSKTAPDPAYVEEVFALCWRAIAT